MTRLRRRNSSTTSTGEPPTGSPVEVVEEFLRRKRVIERYDRLFESAQTTAIPVLNENRLRTLIGDFPG